MKTRFILLGADFLIFSCSGLVVSRWFGFNPLQLWGLYLVFCAVRYLFFIRMGLYHAVLRFAGFPLAVTILKASTMATLVCVVVSHFQSSHQLPVGFFAADYLVTTFLVGLTRFAPRYLFDAGRRASVRTRRVLIYGAGEVGEQVARKLFRDPEGCRLVGFIDDDTGKIGKRLHNLRIVGPVSDLGVLLSRLHVSELIIAITALSGEVVRKIAHECRRHGVFCRIVPSFSNMLKQDVSIKNIDISDLLKREPKDLDEPQIQRFITGKSVLITGAGGSIGAELSRLCVRYGAKKLIMVDHSEFNLYSLQEELSAEETALRFCLLNVLNAERLAAVFAEERPSLVFHAAAYKHVPIVEENPCEGIINNIQGTLRTAELAETYGVERFVLISTDKAVRPTSVMGASKRVAELYIQNFNTRSQTEFIAVRFGNVLGSSGSVIPKFIDQINRGGPVTVTHPEVTRYFMLLSEAVQLVLQAASIGRGGEIFILNMGSPVRIAEMAEDLIFLAGREPHKDIKVEFSGLRPGEKLFEELLIDETEKKTQYENITIGRATHVNWDRLCHLIDTLCAHAARQDKEAVLSTLKTLIPEFTHAGVEVETAGKVVSLFS